MTNTISIPERCIGPAEASSAIDVPIRASRDSRRVHSAHALCVPGANAGCVSSSFVDRAMAITSTNEGATSFRDG